MTVTVTQQKHSPWSWNTEMLRPRLDPEPDMQAFMPDEILVQEMALPLPADGVIPIPILLSHETVTVTIDVRPIFSLLTLPQQLNPIMYVQGASNHLIELGDLNFESVCNTRQRCGENNKIS